MTHDAIYELTTMITLLKQPFLGLRVFLDQLVHFVSHRKGN